MPELPEVQTIVNELNKKIAGAVISSVWCDWKKMVTEPKKWEEFEEKLTISNFKFLPAFATQKALPARNASRIDADGQAGQISKKGRKIKRVKRVGKFIVFELEDDLNLVVHLRMTGHFLVIDEKKRNNRKDPIYEKVNNYIHFKLILDDGREIALSDLRKFAKISLTPGPSPARYLASQDDARGEGSMIGIGIDPFDEDFTFDKFKELLENKKGNIKQILMDQSVICGIGNIYSSEILWEAKVSPLRKIESLKNSELEEVYKAIIRVLRLAIEKRGSSESDYRDTDGKKGEYQNIQRVYQREGQECYRDDGGIIKRVKTGQRSGFWCPECQK